MAQTDAERQRRYRERKRAREAGTPTPPQNAAQAAPEPSEAAGIVKQRAAPGMPAGLYLDHLTLTFVADSHAYRMQLSPNEAGELSLRLAAAVQAATRGKGIMIPANLGLAMATEAGNA